MKHTLFKTEHASAAWDSAAKLQSAVNDQLTISELIARQVLDALEVTAEDLGIQVTGEMRSGSLIFVPKASHRQLLYLVGEVESRCAQLTEIVEDHHEHLTGILDALEQGAGSHALVSPGLEGAISVFTDAHAALRALGEGGWLAAGTVEEDAFNAALKSLVGFPCHSLPDVLRKASFFVEHEFLRCECFEDEGKALLRSFMGSEGAAS